MTGDIEDAIHGISHTGPKLENAILEDAILEDAIILKLEDAILGGCHTLNYLYQTELVEVGRKIKLLKYLVKLF